MVSALEECDPGPGVNVGAVLQQKPLSVSSSFFFTLTEEMLHSTADDHKRFLELELSV